MGAMDTFLQATQNVEACNDTAGIVGIVLFADAVRSYGPIASCRSALQARFSDVTPVPLFAVCGMNNAVEITQ